MRFFPLSVREVQQPVRFSKMNNKIRFVRLILALPLFLSGCCGGPQLWGGTSCDNLVSPNWDNRHAKFVRWLDHEVGKPFPTQLMCSSRFVLSDQLTNGNVAYSYVHSYPVEHTEKCSYQCIVDQHGIVTSTSFTGTKQSCYLTLN